MFIKRKKHGRQIYFRLAHSQREGQKIRQFSVYLGATLALTAQEWVDTLKSATGFHPTIREVLPVMEAYVRRHSLPWSTLDGIKAAMVQESRQSWSRRFITPSHRLLGLQAGATPKQIQAAFHRSSRTHHPDVAGGSAEEFRKLAQARDQLIGQCGPTSGPAQPYVGEK